MLIFSFAICLIIFLSWGFKNLPGEKWQILGAVPSAKQKDGSWRGINFTYYGLFNALSLVLATSVMIIMTGALSVSSLAVVCIFMAVITPSLPAAKWIAWIVEKKNSTFSVGGASFVGMIIAPWCILFTKKCVGFEAPVISVMAALTVSYAFGEGIGRLSCISFGCCYGKPLSECGRFLQNCFKRHHFIFTGKTKKIAYAHGLDGHAVLPIQAVTSSIYCASGILGILLFSNGLFTSAFLETLMITQLWRFISEFFRNDYRGRGKISVYQKLSLAAVLYGLLTAVMFKFSGNYPVNLLIGLKTLWNPAVLLFLQFLGMGIFFYLGKSSVTGSVLSFYIKRNKI